MKRFLSVSTALAFACFFIGLIIIADLGEGSRWWAFVEEIPFGDKLGHIGITGTLSLLFNHAFPTRKLGRLTRFFTLSTLVLLVLLSIEEVAQAFIPSRTCDFFDWLADVVGLTSGQVVASALLRRCAKRSCDEAGRIGIDGAGGAGKLGSDDSETAG